MIKAINIVIAEPSVVVSMGLAAVLNESGTKYNISLAASLDEIELLFTRKAYDIVVVSPALVFNNTKQFNSLKCRFIDVKWICVLYNLIDSRTLALFDAFVQVTDTPGQINTTIYRLAISEESKQSATNLSEILSERETEVLKLLATGSANKEIAERLNISINTVITHRKNISQKTGIKSVSGLTIYAVAQNLISLDSISE